MVFLQAMRDYSSHDKQEQELRHPEDGNRHFGAAQASMRARVHMERCGTAHQPGTHGERLCWSRESHFISLTVASTSILGNACMGRQAKEEKDTRKRVCVAVEKVYTGASKLCPWGEPQNSPAKGEACKAQFPNLHLSRPFLQHFSGQSKSESFL